MSRLSIAFATIASAAFAAMGWSQEFTEICGDPLVQLVSHAPSCSSGACHCGAAWPQCGKCAECAEPCPCQKAKKKAEELKAKVAGAYKPVFYNNDFSYLDDPCYTDWMPGDALKRMAVTPWATVDIGGQYRARYHSEHNIRNLGPTLGLTGADDDFLLHRTRLFANAELGEFFRVYAEGIDAESNYENLSPRAIEVNRSDMQNLFLDVKLYEDEKGKLIGRGGRQELIYGDQRYISPLDWANTRRTFEGGKLLWAGKDWNIDVFYVNPVVTDPHNFDSPDYDQDFWGVYSTYKGLENDTLELYSLGYNTAGFDFYTSGARYLATCDQWLFEVEGAAQSGDFMSFDHWTGATTIGVGRNMSEGFEWDPVLWVYYDYAGGDNTLGNGFHHLFPLSHKYFGFMDLYGRRNIESINAQLALQPHKDVKILAWWYYLWLETGSDVPYNVNMTPYNPGFLPADTELGHELDLLVTWTPHPRLNFVFGYSHFFAGDYYEQTPGVLHRGDADFFYTHTEFNF